MIRLSLIVLICLCGCAPPSRESRSANTSAANRTDVANLASTIFATRDSITLLSHDGEWIGADYDLELQLHDDNSAMITDFGYAVERTPASFLFDDQGRLVIIPNGGTPWPSMPVTMSDGKLVVLAPTDVEIRRAAIAAGMSESEITPEAIAKSYDQWPLRQVLHDEDGGSSGTPESD